MAEGLTAPGDSPGAHCGAALMCLSGDELVMIALFIVPDSLPVLLRLNRKFHGLSAQNVLWFRALKSAFGFPFLTPVPPHDAKRQLRRLRAVTGAAVRGERWRFHGYEREGPDITNAALGASAFEWRLEMDRGADCDQDPGKGPGRHAAKGVLWWWKVQSRWGNTDGMGSWEPEYLEGTFDRATGTFQCHGIACGSGLACAAYEFRLQDAGLSVVERGTGMTDHQQYMVGLAEDPLVENPVAYVLQLYFPGEPPGLRLERWVADNEADVQGSL